MPVGQITRGTTGYNRLRRNDRYLTSLPVLRQTTTPLVVDLGYGAHATTAVELYSRLTKINPSVQVLGLEIEPSRVSAALPYAHENLSFALGGFEIPRPDNKPVAIIRALNVLRQYNETDVVPAWQRMLAALQPDGLLVEGTCNEVGRVASWVTVAKTGPVAFTVSLKLGGLESPDTVAERLPKILIHRNVPGERIHKFLTDLEKAWASNAGLGALSAVQRWRASVHWMKSQGWQITSSASRIRLGELSLPFDQVAPVGFSWPV